MTSNLLLAIERNFSYREIREMVRNHPYTVMKGDQNGILPVHRASQAGNLPVINLLLAWGADPNSQDKNGYTPLHYAVYFADFETVRLLINNNARSTFASNNGQTPLHLLAARIGEFDCFQIFQYLLRYGARLDAKDESGLTPCDYACAQENESFLTISRKVKSPPIA